MFLSVVLGRPGSGCSTFLKTLANQRGEYHSVEGEVHYDSLSPEDIAKHYRGDVTYCPEDDSQLLHFTFYSYSLLITALRIQYIFQPSRSSRPSDSPPRRVHLVSGSRP